MTPTMKMVHRRRLDRSPNASKDIGWWQLLYYLLAMSWSIFMLKPSSTMSVGEMASWRETAALHHETWCRASKATCPNNNTNNNNHNNHSNNGNHTHRIRQSMHSSYLLVEAFDVPRNTRLVRRRHFHSTSTSTTIPPPPLTTPFPPSRPWSSTSSSSWSSSTSSSLSLWAQDWVEAVVAAGTKRKKEKNNDAHRIKNGHSYLAPGSDPPLASLVHVGGPFTLVPTEEDVIDKLDVGQRLVCLGDVHGDLDALQRCLELAQVYDRNTNTWCGGNTILVQCGDILDRGTQELPCYSLLAKLSHEAAKVDGKIVLLAGNHEVMNALGHFEYAIGDAEYEDTVGKQVDEQLLRASSTAVTGKGSDFEYTGTIGTEAADEIKQRLEASTTTTMSSGDFEYNDSIGKEVSSKTANPASEVVPQWRTQYAYNQPARWTCYEPGGLLAASLVSNMKVAFQVGRTVCVHAGLRPHHVLENGGIAGMNKAFRDWILMEHGTEEEAPDSQNNNPNRSPPPQTTTIPPKPIKYNHKGKFRSNAQIVAEAQQRLNYYKRTMPSFLSGSTAPIWMRDYSWPSDLPPKDPMTTQTMLDNTLSMLRADRMVMGHTIQRQVNAAMDGKAWRVDIGVSQGCGSGRPEVLEIVGASEAGGETVFILTQEGRVPAADRLVQSIASAL